MKGWKRAGALLLAGTMVLGSGLTASAEEVNPMGYHVYETSETEVADNWYGVARGSYLEAGMAKLTEVDSTHVNCSGMTFARMDCDRVYVRVYLDESDTAKAGSWGTIDYWTGETFGGSLATAESGAYKITQGKYYRAKGAHSVTQDDYTEATDTCTDALPM